MFLCRGFYLSNVTKQPRDSIAAMNSNGIMYKSRWTVLLVATFLVLANLFVSAAPVPTRLSDEQFWKLATDSSEDDGYFRSDNLLSNETTFQYVIPEVLKVAKQGRVYLGVGPEQNFTYMAALKPSMAFIIDIRHGNFDVQLLYKALFELSADRADFVSRLFSRKRPAGLTAQSSVTQIFDAILASASTKQVYEENLKTIEDHLMKKHNFALTSGDREGIAWALSNYYRFGPNISYGSSLSTGVAPPSIVGATTFGRFGNNMATYEALMTAEDGQGQNRGYLANEENFNFLKDLQTRNLVIPVVGDFAGNKAIRAVGRYLKSVDGMVSAFYVSNVEQFLVDGGTWDTFCRSVDTLPHDESSMFIRSGRGGIYTVNSTGGNVQNSSAARMLPELQCSAAR